jgi:hypothetical protein
MGLYRLARNTVRDRRGRPIVGRHRRRSLSTIVVRRDRAVAEPRHRLLLDPLNVEPR